MFSTEEIIEKHAPTQMYEALRRKYTDSCIKSLATTKKCGKCKQTIKRYTLYQCKFLMPLSKVEVAEKFEFVDLILMKYFVTISLLFSKQITANTPSSETSYSFHDVQQKRKRSHQRSYCHCQSRCFEVIEDLN